ncbi:BspA family leucine-rich repeat surface protein [Pseudopedobacter beijingensis]|uniref:BspA family leucine-rich repeat surface protein n=1 Tax=Pseudopedobacter beijingensis TaxID=1207056 RepID=A0ABW4IBN2_9SPHI
MKAIKMRRRILIVMCFVLFATSGFSQTEFVTVWRTDNPSGRGNITTTKSQIKLPLGARNYNISWVKVGNPSVNSNGISVVAGSNTVVTFPSPGDYEIRLTSVNSTQAFLFTFGVNSDTTDSKKLIDVKQWGTLTKWDNVSNIFRDCINMDISATDKLVLMRNVSSMFLGCESLVGNESFNTWQMDGVNNISNMFSGAIAFNQPIGNWNTGTVTNMSGLFNGAVMFNQDIGNWNTEKVINMSNMFNGAMAFNQPIGNWNTSVVTNMNSMFSSARGFNQPLVTNGNKWDVSAVTNLNGVFNTARAFNQSLASWKLNPAVTTVNFMPNSNIDCENYQNTLAGWAENLPELTEDKVLNVNGRKYYGQLTVANRNIIIGKKWILSGDMQDGTVCGFPVTFTGVKASLSNSELLVQWKTTAEKDNQYFTICLSKDGEKWTELDQVSSKAGGGNSNTVLEYSHSVNISGVQLAGIPVIFSLFLLVLLLKRRNASLFIAMVLFGGVFFTNCTKTKEVEPEALYVKIMQIDREQTVSESKIVLVKRLK